MRHAKKSKILCPQWRGKWKSDLEAVSGTGSPQQVNRFFQLVDPVVTRSFDEIS